TETFRIRRKPIHATTPLFRVDFVCNRSESRQRAQCVSMAFSLHALAAQKMPQLQIHLRRHAAEKPAIHARCSKTNPSNSQTAGQRVHSLHLHKWLLWQHPLST
ncbi:MAG: hypothetical protein ACI84R_004169, partial [Candidatus Azotimanducaceae bacterium]